MAKIACPKCNSKKLYKLQSGKRRCAQCRHEFIPHKLPLTFSRGEWKKIIHLFLMEQSSNSINEQTGFEQRRVLRALTNIRFVMMQDVPEIFSGTVEVDETYIGGQWKNKRKIIRDKGTKRGRGTEKQLVFGDSRESLLATPQYPARYDYEYTRNGTASIFLFSEPLIGWRKVNPRKHRNKKVGNLQKSQPETVVLS